MKYDLSTVLKSYKGEEIKLTAEPDSPVATLRYALEQACVNADATKHATPAEKYSIYKLLQRIHAAEKEVELDAADVTLLKTLVGEGFFINVMGPVFDLLEQKGT